MQQLGRADAVENVDAEARLPGVADRLRQRLAGRGADAQARRRRARCFSVSSLSIAENSVGTPKKMLGLYLFISANIARRRRPLGIEHRGGADRHRKGQRVAEAIGEKQFCRRQADIVLANAEHLLGIGVRGRGEIGMQMPHALGHAGRARRIQPERRLVGMGRGGRECIAFAREFVGQFLVAMRVLAGDDDMIEIRHPPEHVLDHRQQRFGDEQHPRAAIRQHIGVLIRGQQRVERHRHDAGADRAEKHDREIDGVEHDHGDALFAADAEPAQHVGDAAALLLQARHRSVRRRCR